MNRRGTNVVLRLFLGIVPVLTAPYLQATKLQVGTNIWTGFEPIYLAREKGLLAADRFNLKEYETSQDVQRAFKNGSVDVAFLSLDEGLALVELGVDAQFFLALDFSTGGDAVVARPSRQAVHPGSIKGKRVGLEVNGTGAFLLSRMLRKQGLSQKDLTVFNLDSTEHLTAFKEGKVDLVVTYEPHISELKKAGGQVIFDSNQVPEEIMDVALVRKDRIQEKKTNLRELARVWCLTLDKFYLDPKGIPILRTAKHEARFDLRAVRFEYFKLLGCDENKRLFSEAEPRIVEKINQIGTQMVRDGLIRKQMNWGGLVYRDALVDTADD